MSDPVCSILVTSPWDDPVGFHYRTVGLFTLSLGVKLSRLCLLLISLGMYLWFSFSPFSQVYNISRQGVSQCICPFFCGWRFDGATGTLESLPFAEYAPPSRGQEQI